MNDNLDFWLYLIYFFLALFWLPAYVLIIRRGFKDKSYGMPIVAMLGNWPWEWIFGFGLFSACPLPWGNCPGGLLQLANLAAAVLDTIIVYTILRYGREKMQIPWVKKNFYVLLLFGVVSSFLIQYAFITEIGFPNVYNMEINGVVPQFLAGDEASSYSAYALTFLMGILFIRMFHVRAGLEGQSFLIALFMMLGNVAAYVFLVLLGGVSPLLAILFWLTLLVNLAFCQMTYQRSKEMGINPWTRFRAQPALAPFDQGQIEPASAQTERARLSQVYSFGLHRQLGVSTQLIVRPGHFIGLIIFGAQLYGLLPGLLGLARVSHACLMTAPIDPG